MSSFLEDIIAGKYDGSMVDDTHTEFKLLLIKEFEKADASFNDLTRNFDGVNKQLSDYEENISLSEVIADKQRINDLEEQVKVLQLMLDREAHRD